MRDGKDTEGEAQCNLYNHQIKKKWRRVNLAKSQYDMRERRGERWEKLASVSLGNSSDKGGEKETERERGTQGSCNKTLDKWWAMSAKKKKQFFPLWNVLSISKIVKFVIVPSNFVILKMSKLKELCHL